MHFVSLNQQRLDKPHAGMARLQGPKAFEKTYYKGFLIGHKPNSDYSCPGVGVGSTSEEEEEEEEEEGNYKQLSRALGRSGWLFAGALRASH